MDTKGMEVTKRFLRYKWNWNSNKPNPTLITRIFPEILFYGTLVFITSIVTNIALASLFGYSIITNFISDLGVRNTNPYALFHDLLCIVGGSLCVPGFNFIYSVLKTQYRSSVSAMVFNKLGGLFGTMGSIGYVFIGVFSSDRAGPGCLYHGISSFFAFGGFILGIFFFSLNLILTHRCKLRKLGIFGAIGPLGLVIALGCCFYPIMEWSLFYTILLFLLGIDYYILTKKKHEANSF